MQKLLVVSACSYAGAPASAYRPFLDPPYREELDRWASSNGSGGLLPNAALTDHGLASAPLYDPTFVERHLADEAGDPNAPVDPARRLDGLDRQGVAAEVLFPDFRLGRQAPFNAVHGRVDAQPELERAGVRAYNRWLASYCATDPTRLIGIAVLPLGTGGDHMVVADALSELEWAKEAGMGGVLVRTVPAELIRNGLPRLGASNLAVEPVWEACEALELPVHTLGGMSLRDVGNGPGSPLLYHYEWAEAANNLLGLFVLGGILDRHPRLHVVLADQGTRRIVDLLDGWDMTHQSPTFDSSYYSMARRPWAYWARQCSVSPAPMRRRDCDLRSVLGVPRLQWSSRYPMPLGGWLDVPAELGTVFDGVPFHETRAIVGENAIRVYGLDRGAIRAVADRIGVDTLAVASEASDREAVDA